MICQRIEHHAQRIDIHFGYSIDVLGIQRVVEQLGGHIGISAGACEAGGEPLHAAGYAKVPQFEISSAVDEYVLGLDVPVDDVVFSAYRKRRTQIHAQLDHFILGQRLGLNPRLKRHQQLHADENIPLQRFGLLDRLIILRVAVNMDVFPGDTTPEMLWASETDDHVASSGSLESVDIFETGMKTCFVTGKVLVDSIRKGDLK